MAKKQGLEIVDDAVIIVSPEQETQALIVAETDKLIESAITDLKKHTVTDEAIAHIKAEYAALSIADINDLQGYNAVKDGARKLMKLRTSIEAKRKELTDPAEKFKKVVKAEADRITAELRPVEEELKKKQKDYEDAVEAAKREEYQKRVNLLTANAYQLVNGFFVCGPIQVHSEELAKITDVQMDVYVSHGKQELERIAAEEKRRKEESERQRQEEERLRLEREQLDKERAEFLAWKAQQQAELKAQTAAIETTYETVVQPTHPIEPHLNGLPGNAPSIEFGTPIHSMPPPEIQNMEAVHHAFVAPEPQPQYHTSPTTAPAPKPGNAAWVPQNEFQRGFNAFRVKLDQLIKSDTKLSKQILHDWAWSLPFPPEK